MSEQMQLVNDFAKGLCKPITCADGETVGGIEPVTIQLDFSRQTKSLNTNAGWFVCLRELNWLQTLNESDWLHIMKL